MTLPIVPSGPQAPAPLPLPPARRGPSAPPPGAAALDMPPLVDAIVPSPPSPPRRDEPPLPPVLAEPDAGDGFSLGAPPTGNGGHTFDAMHRLAPQPPPVSPLLGLGWAEPAWPMTDSAYTVLASLGAMKRARNWGELRDIADQAAEILDPHMADLLRTAAEQQSEALGITPRWDIVQGPIEMAHAIPGGAVSPIADAMQGGALLWDGLTGRSRTPELEALRGELRHARNYDEADLADLLQRAGTLGDMERADFYFDLQDVLSGAVEPQDMLSVPDPTEGWLYQEAAALRDAFTVDPTPGWEDSGWRQLGTDVGGFAGGLATVSALGPYAGGAVLALGGAGQAGNRALDWAKQTGEPLDRDQLFRSTAAGLAAGAFSVLPLGRLTGKIPLLRQLGEQAAPGPWGAATTVASSAGVQALIGAGQGGLTQMIQNKIAQQVYDGDQSLFDGVAGTVRRGGLINGIAGALPVAVEAMPWTSMDDSFGF